MVRRITLILALVALAGLATAPAVAAARGGSGTGTVSTDVVGTCSIGGVTGTIQDVAVDLDRFASQAGRLVAQGTVTGECVVGTVTQSFTIPFSDPVSLNQLDATCEILELVLGPLHLEILGLVVDLNQVILTITAEPGPGNLLGNLLCAIAGLLDNSPINTGVLANLLNQLLGLLGGLLG
jgi:hypothetical protein